MIPVAIVHMFIRAEGNLTGCSPALCATNVPILLCRRTCKLCTLRSNVSPGNARCSSCCSQSDVHERGPRISTQIRSMELRLQRPVWRANVYSVRQSQRRACWNHTESRSSGRVGAFIPHLQHGLPGDGRHVRQRRGR